MRIPRRFNRHAYLGMDDDRDDPRRFREHDPRAGFAPPDGGGLNHDPSFYKQRDDDRSFFRPAGWDEHQHLAPSFHEADGTLHDPARAEGGMPPAPRNAYPRPQPQTPEQARTSYVGLGPPRVRSDKRIEEDVCQALEDDEEIDASEIEVSVSSGEVVLKGKMIGDREDRHRVEDIVYGIPGVTDVINEIRVFRSEGVEANP